LEAWIDGVARTLVRQHISARARYESGLDRHADGSNVPAPIDPQARSRALLRSLLEEVPVPGREVLIRFDIEEQDMEAMVEELRRPEPTIRGQLNEARRILKEALDRHEARVRRETGTAAVVPIFGVIGLLQEFRDIQVPDDVRETVWERLRHLVDPGGGGGGGCGGDGGGPAAPAIPPAPSGAGVSSVAALGWNGPTAALAFLGLAGPVALGITIGALWDPLHGGHREHLEARAEATLAASTASASGALSSASAPSATSAASTQARRAAPIAVSDAASEDELMDRVHRALRDGHTDQALAACEEHARRYPRSSLASKRDVLWISALIRAGRRTEARQRIESYAAAHPDDPQADALRAQLDASP
jgi:TolA-binding protein